MTSPNHRTDRLVRPRHVVTAILVAHDGVRWLPTTLHAVKTQRRPVQRFVVVDTGSRDGTRELLERSVGSASVLEAARTTGFGEAARIAVAAFAGAPGLASTRSEAGAPVDWIWLLHDDSAPEPGALESMLALADDMPSAVVIGPKLRGWVNPRALLEFGVSVDRGGQRETGLEPGELDHGQHDGDRDVLAVSTAGMLVRRDVWDDLGGLDAELPLFRDDLDFGWRANLAGYRVVVCSKAILRHAEAISSGARRIAAGSPYPRRLDRQAALRTMLVNGSGPWLAWVGTRLLLASLLRSLVFVATKRPADAWDELVATLSVFGRPWRIARARRARAATRRVPPRALRRLLAPRGARLRHDAEALAARLGALSHPDGVEPARRLSVRILTNPGVLLVAALTVLALVTDRHVLSGGLRGGALLPAPVSAGDLWQVYTQHWHPTGFGSFATAPPYLAVVAVLGFVTFGSARLAVALLMIGAVPLAGWSAYASTRRLTGSRWLRLWAAGAYALAPATTGAVRTGRLGSAAAIIVLPLVLHAGIRSLVVPLTARAAALRRAERRAGRRPVGLRPAWGTALLLAVAASFEPILVVLLAPFAVAAAVVGLVRRTWVVVRRAVVVLAVPPLLLLPWSARVWQHPALLVVGVGRTSADLQAVRLHPLDLALLHPGGPGAAPLWLYAIVPLAGLAGLLQLTRPGPARLGWLFGLVGLGAGLLVSQLHVRPPGSGSLVGWPGTACALATAGLLMSAVAGGDRLRARLAETTFGWRQPVAAALTGLTFATPVVALVLWVGHGSGPLLAGGSPEVLPAYVTAESGAQGQPRTVALRPASAGTVGYTLLRNRSPQLGDADLPPDPRQVRVLDVAVGDLAGGLGQRAATELAHAGVRYVLVPSSASALNAALAAAGGLQAQTAGDGWQLWQVDTPAGRIALAEADSDEWQLPAGAGAVGRKVASVPVPYAPSARYVVLAEAPSPAWRAGVVAGAGNASGLAKPVPLTSTSYQGLQAFELPASAANLVISRAPDRRADWLTFQLVALLVVVAGCTPSGRRTPIRSRPQARAAATDEVAV